MEQDRMRLCLSLTLIFAPIAAIATDNPRTPTAELTPPEAVVRLADAAFAELVAPGGPAEPNWDKQGVDLIARLSAAPGGIDQTATVAESAGDRSVDHYGNGALPIPSGLEPVLDLPARPTSGDIGWRSISELGEGMWMRTSTRLARRGNALCGRGWDSLTILAPAGRPLSEDMRFAIMVVRLMAERMAALETCVIAFEQPDGSLIERSFLSDGRSLPKVDEQTKPIRLRPLAEAAAVLTP
ncbi:hypothetical protein K9B35_01280 [Sphingomonas sp. R647]|uniref:hypothetical protein n=1 Tax=Sphingomonas sp. R647 TaxID=2875233 RepID=UPI001CD7949E|nr:hypothetical protein [Sphingomonas sp. R647]MCA1196591.1 hypothetical protein [Sphingomonas sp. R647]